jgi:hypothetical protein
MSIVNTILNKVDLNTTKYSEKLRKMGKDTRKQAKGIGDDFKQLGGAWKAAVAAIAAGALSGAIAKELMSTEKAVASFIQSTGGIKEARAQFEMLQQAARDTIQPFDALKAASLDLRRNGVEPTAAQLKTFSQIAYGTGQSLETVASAFTGVIRGNYRGLQQLGIKAQDTGTTLQLTYKGVTTEIEKNTAALTGYFAEIGRENEGVLDYLQSGLTGAANQMENAWGDFYRAIAESGLGDLFRDMVRDAATSLDDITAWINENREPIKAFFADVGDSWRTISKTAKDVFDGITRASNDFWEESGLAATTGCDSMIDALSQLFNFARAGFLQVMKYANLAWAGIRGIKDIGAASFEGVLTAIKTGSLAEGQKVIEDAIIRAAESSEEIIRLYDNATDDLFGDIKKNLDRIRLARLGYEDLKPGEIFNYRTWEKGGAPKSREFGQQTTTAGGKRGGGGRSAPKPEKDGWPEYYAGLASIARQGYSDIEKLRAEHGDRIAELNRQFAASQSATDAEYLAARKILDDDYIRQYKDKQKEARDFLREMKNDEMADLDNEYRERLEKLKWYYDQGLILEQDYQDGLADIRKDYDGKRKGAKKQIPKELQEEIDGINDMAGGISNLSSAFGELTQGMNESSAGYKALFALQKSFAVASATMNALAVWMEALDTKPFIPAGLAAYANAVALTTGILGQLKSVTMHDKGGSIPAGGLGIVGEYGPEVIAGPANITSRRKTADLARSAMSGGSVTVNLYEDASRAGQSDTETRDGDRIINIFVSNIRRGGQMAKTLENTYQIRRYGA